VFSFLDGGVNVPNIHVRGGLSLPSDNRLGACTLDGALVAGVGVVARAGIAFHPGTQVDILPCGAVSTGN